MLDMHASFKHPSGRLSSTFKLYSSSHAEGLTIYKEERYTFKWYNRGVYNFIIPKYGTLKQDLDLASLILFTTDHNIIILYNKYYYTIILFSTDYSLLDVQA